MRNGTLFYSALLLVLYSTGCKTSIGRDFDTARIADFQLGETDGAQLEAWLGEPLRAGEMHGAGGGTRIEYYQFAASNDEGAKGRTLGIELAEERLRGYLLDSSLEADSTDFDPALLEFLTPGLTTAEEVRVLLGEPSGRFLLPSNLLIQEFGTELPDETFEVWAWRSSRTARSLIWLKTRTRSLALYFDAEGLLLYERYRDDRK